MLYNYKLYLKYNNPSFFSVLKKMVKIISFFKNIIVNGIINILSIFNIQINPKANPLININDPIIFNFAGFDHKFSFKFFSFFYSYKNLKIYNLTKFDKKINLLKNNIELNYLHKQKKFIPLTILESFIYSDSDFIVRKVKLDKINFNEYLYFDNKSDNIIVIAEKWSFFHFYLQIIPFIIQTNYKKKYSILLRKNDQKFFKSLIKIFFNDQVKQIDFNKFKTTKKFILKNKNFYPNKKNIFLLRKFLKIKYKLNFDKSKNFYIYVKRSNGSVEDNFDRKILNEKQLIKILKNKYNFKIVDPLKISNIKQIKLFNQCKGIISLHGANLANLIVVNKKCKILELNKNFDVRWHYYKVINNLGLSKNYKILIAKTHNNKLMIDINKNFLSLLDNLFKN